MKKLFFIYTNPRFITALYEPVMARQYDGSSQVDVTFLLDQSILKDTLANDVISTADVEIRLERLIRNCQEAGADCVVVGCTAMNLATNNLASRFSVPVISVDEPMVQRIAADSRKCAAVLTHAEDNGETIRRRLAALGISSRVFVVPGAKQAMGDKAALAKLFEACASELSPEYDCIALGHVSAEDVPFAGIALPVYRSGRECIEEINKALNIEPENV